MWRFLTRWIRFPQPESLKSFASSALLLKPLQSVHPIFTFSKPFAGLLLWLVSFISQGQVVPSNNLANWLAKGYPIAKLDTSINVNPLSRQACGALIEQMFTIDQQYRDSLYHSPQASAKQTYYGKLMSVNDQVNQTLLLKILKRHGWPCQPDRSLSRKVWFIAWHSRGDYAQFSQFYRYLQKARGCIDASLFKEMQEQIAALRAVGYK